MPRIAAVKQHVTNTQYNQTFRDAVVAVASTDLDIIEIAKDLSSMFDGVSVQGALRFLAVVGIQVPWKESVK